MSVSFTVAVANTPLPSQANKVPIIVESVKAAGMWLNSFVKGLGTIDISVRFDPTIPTMNASSTSNQFLGNIKTSSGNTYTLLQDSVPAEWQTGRDINGAASDMVINIGTTNLDRFYWFDPTLTTSTDIPRDKTDGFRVLLHEILHGMGFNGFVSTAAAGSTNAFATQYDLYYTSTGERNFFVGPNAMGAFGGPVPVTGPHLGDAISFSQGILTGSKSVMSYDYVPNGARISMDPVVIGVLRDVGFAVRDTQAVLQGQPGEIGVARIDSKSAGYTLTSTLDLKWLTFKDKSEYAYLLQDIKRLQFSDVNIALDVDGNAGTVAKILGAVFGKTGIKNKEYVGIGLSLLDMGMTYENLMQLAMNAKLGTYTHADVVNLLYTNVVGASPDAEALNFYKSQLDNNLYTPGGLGVLAAETALNIANIDLVGLALTGIEFTG